VSLQSALAAVLIKNKKTEPVQITDSPQVAQVVAVSPVVPKKIPAQTVMEKPVVQSNVSFKQSPEPAVGGVRQPAYVPHIKTGQPDVATVKKMLRQSGKERPPGQ
jgi:hypothetical protein